MDYEQKGYATMPGNSKPTSVYELHERAVMEFHTACKNFAEAALRREQASAQLQEATQSLSQSIQVAMQDPTAAPQTNGSLQQQAYQLRF